MPGAYLPELESQDAMPGYESRREYIWILKRGEIAKDALWRADGRVVSVSPREALVCCEPPKQPA
jgi:hypothetical protein